MNIMAGVFSFCIVSFSELSFQEKDLYNFHFDLDLMSCDSDLWNITGHAYAGNLPVVFCRCDYSPHPTRLSCCNLRRL